MEGQQQQKILIVDNDERVLRQLFGHTYVADDASQPGNQPGRLDPPHSVDGTMGIGDGHGGAPWRSNLNLSKIRLSKMPGRCKRRRVRPTNGQEFAAHNPCPAS